MNLFLDASAVLAACGRPAGASRAVFDLATRNGWTLMTSPYVVTESEPGFHSPRAIVAMLASPFQPR